MAFKASLELRKEILTLSRPSTFRFIFAAGLDWAVIASAIATSLYYSSVIIYFAAIFLIATRQHALGVLSHDGSHFRAHKDIWFNDLISDLLCAYPIFFDTAIYRHTHYAHHEHLNSDRDPDWVRKFRLDEWKFPKTAGQIALFAIPYVLYKGAREWLLNGYYFSGLMSVCPHKISRSKKFRKLAFWVTALSLIVWAQALPIFIMYWIIPFYFVFPLLQRIRSVAEHFALSYESDLQSSRDISPSKIEAYLMAPHGIHFHLCHHLYPSVPFYNLRKLHTALMKDPEYRSKSHQNTSYLWPSRASLWKDLTRLRPQSQLVPNPQQMLQKDVA